MITEVIAEVDKIVQKDSPELIVELDTSSSLIGAISSNLENFDYSNGVLNVTGWAYGATDQNSATDKIFIALLNSNNAFLFETKSTERTDVSEYFKNENIVNCGFERVADLDLKEKGRYEVAVAIKKENGQILINSFNNINTIVID